ncbi:MAG TPA: hypothetical protein VJP39_02100, partial [Gaiellaceae bacterium]|nr:hypothetical protein [Gaiellaceae bacterium]
VQSALREGRAVSNPRDAALAVQIAEHSVRAATRWPFRLWLFPATPWQRLWRAAHAVTVVVGLALAARAIWSAHYGHWIVVGYVSLLLLSIPSFVMIYRLLANAPRALEANRRMLELSS